MDIVVRNLKSKKGRVIPNHFIIQNYPFNYFKDELHNSTPGTMYQVYGKNIVFTNNKITLLDRYLWQHFDCPKGKSLFLNETIKEIREKLINGTYKLKDLN